MEEFTANRTEEARIYEPIYSLEVVIPMAIFLIFIIILSIGGNFMVIMTIIRHKGMRTRTNMFITNLAVSDILAAVFDMPVSLVTLIKGEWVFGEEFCQFNGFTMALFLITSIHTLMYISIHKFISITRPFSRFMTPTRIFFMIIGTWVWSILYGVGAILGWNKSLYKPGATQCGPSYPNNTIKMSHSLVNTTFNFLIPLIVMSVCYVLIFREIRKHMTRMIVTSNIDQRNTLIQQKRIAKTLFMVMTCFLLCLSPYITYSCTAAFSKNKNNIPAVLNPLSYWFIYTSCACNPIIYAFRSASFRQGYKEIVCGKPVHYYSGGSFRSVSQRSWSFRSSVRSTNPNQDLHNINGNTRHPRRHFQQPSLRRCSGISWTSMYLQNGRRRSSNQSLQYDSTASGYSQNHGSINRKFSKTKNDHNILNNKEEFSTIAEVSVEETSSISLCNGIDGKELIILPSSNSSHENDNENSEITFQEQINNGENAATNGTSIHNQQICDEFNERKELYSKGKQKHSDDAFYDSDVELEDQSAKIAQKAREKRKLRSRSCIIHKANGKSGKTVLDIVDAQMKLIQLTDRDLPTSTKRLERAHSWNEFRVQFTTDREEAPSMEAGTQPVVDYLAVPQTLNTVHSEGDLLAEECKKSPISKRLTNSFKQLFRKSQEKYLESTDKAKESTESMI